MKCLYIICLLFLLPIAGKSQTLLDLNKKFVELFQQGKYEEAIPYAESAFDKAKKELNTAHPDYATNLENLGWVYLTAGYYSKAVPVYQELITIKEILFGKEHPDYATMVNNLAILYYYMGEYVKAEPYYLESLRIRKKILGEDHPDYATSLDNLAALYAAVDEYEKAEPLYKQAMGIRKQVLGETDDDYITSLNNLASLYLSKGDYANSEPLYLQAASIRKKTKGEVSVEFATSINNLGALYLAIGQYDKAEAAFTVSKEIREELLGQNHPSYLISINNLSQLYAAMGQYEKAISFCQQTITIRKKMIGENHPDYATSLNNLGVLYAELGEYEKAQPFCIESAGIRKKIFGINHTDYAASVNNLGMIYKGLGQNEKAESCYVQAKEIYKKLQGGYGSAYVTSINNLAVLYITVEEYAKAEPAAIEGSSIALNNLIKIFPTLTEKEKGNYLANKSAIEEINNNLIYSYPKASSALRTNNFNLQLVLKSMALSDTKNMIASIRNSKDSAIIQMLSRWTVAKNFLAKQYSLPIDKRESNLAELEGKTEKLEKELNRMSASFRHQQLAERISINELQKKLQKDEVAIEFVSFHLYSKRWTDSVFYAACILRKDDAAPLFVPLFEERQLQHLFNSAGTTATSMVNSFYRGFKVENTNAAALSKELYQLVWLPLEPYLIGAKTISYSPAGKLHSIAFHALQVDSNTVLMDKYQLQQYTSTRQVVLKEIEKQNKQPQKILLFGDASFNTDSVALAKKRESKGNSSRNIYVLQAKDTRGAWSQLPGTAQEVKAIQSLFVKNKTEAKVFTQLEASEENLKELSGKSPQILHIATHGFFLPAADNKRKENSISNENTFTLANDPLLRSGLILAGGNYAWSGKTPIEGGEDGIATAYEISQLNLSNTELVVLSACETALGDVKGSEGVFGLQRAFKMAGVKKMIVSLWQVPDKETAELMTSFYSYWMKGKTINDAFTQAQADMRKKYSPFYWAAFVLVE
ncbi:hypothetical protein CAP36_08910 [Chitinophagaceae bacterium IBVUCB2]|nr:hypothetical protein CAP36_08910 [Chitinophagaceae bacterium IBVUCB2]